MCGARWGTLLVICPAVPPPHKCFQILVFSICPLHDTSMRCFVRLIDGLAERSKAVASGAIPKGREEALMLLALVQIPQPSMVLADAISVRAPFGVLLRQLGTQILRTSWWETGCTRWFKKLKAAHLADSARYPR